MTRKKKIIRNLILIFIVLFVFFNTSGICLSPVSAHTFSDRRFHYGPSEIIHIEDVEDGKYFLCKFDKWISCDYIQKTMLFIWSMGSGSPTGIENDISKGFVISGGSYSGGKNYRNFIYGIINNRSITRVEIVFKNGDKLTQTTFYNGMFIITWRNEKGWNIDAVNGYDSDSNLIYLNNSI